MLSKKWRPFCLGLNVLIMGVITYPYIGLKLNLVVKGPLAVWTLEPVLEICISNSLTIGEN